MKDAYSFCESEEQMLPIYEAMKQAYANVFARCGLDYRMVEADSDLIGGDLSHEFIVLAEGGEDRIVECENCGHVAMLSRAVSALPQKVHGEAGEVPISELATPGVETIEDLARFLDVSPAKLLKTLVYFADEEYVAVIVRGDHEVNEDKCRKLLGAESLRLASASEVMESVGTSIGYLGPSGLDNLQLIVDAAVMTGGDFVAGANLPGKHLAHVLPRRDFVPTVVGDIRMVKSSDLCPHCGGPLEIRKGLEAGHLFHLGHKYSSKLEASFLDASGTSRNLVMGCYGIGVSRLPAAIIEQNHDENGIIWPQEVAPFTAVVIPVSDSTLEASLELYEELGSLVPDILIDDRDVSAGVKFKDSDLMGIPYKIIVGNSFVKDNTLEIKGRSDGRIVRVEPRNVTQKLRELIEQCKTEN
jgi:prolyl-tRNA synthetase